MNRRIIFISLLTACAVMLSPSVQAQFELGKLGRKAKQALQQNRGKVKQAVTSGVQKAKSGTLSSQTYEFNGHTYTTKGDFNPNFYTVTATGQVTFTNVPSSYEEFEDVYTHFLGKSAQGVGGMMVMAIEMYFRDRELGEKCIDLISTRTSASSAKRILYDKLKASATDPNYGQRYLPAACLEGANNKNAYTPKMPYTVNMVARNNKHEESEFIGGIVMYLYIEGDGWDTSKRPLRVLKPFDGELYKVQECSSLITQCKLIRGTWPGLQ